MALLHRHRRGDRLAARRLASELGTDDEELVRDLLDAAIDVGVLEEALQVRCPRCGSRVDRAPLIEAIELGAEAYCPDCEEPIERPNTLAVDERFGLSAEGDAEVQARQQQQTQKPRLTALIHCALLDELRAVGEQMARYSDVEEHASENGQIHLGSAFEGEYVMWEIRAAFAQQGNAASAAAMTQAAADWRPAVALFVGVAGGLPGEVERGDVIAADRVVDYERGKDTSTGYEVRSLQHASAFRLTQRAGISAMSDDWRERIVPAVADLAESREFAVKLEPIAAGEKVVASSASGSFRRIREAAPRAAAVEMEGAGFLEAVHRLGDVDGMVIRGISDLLDDKRRSDAAGWQRQAAANAAAFAFELLYRLRPSSQRHS